MKKSAQAYETHLTFREFSVPAGGEWFSQLAGWSVIQIQSGTGYFLQTQSNQELATGAVLVVASGVTGRIRASQLADLTFHAFSVVPSRLTGLITLTEQGLLELAASRRENFTQLFAAGSPVAAKMTELHAGPQREGLLFRLRLLQQFFEIVGQELTPTTPNLETTDARARLELFLTQTPISELIEMNFSELAEKTHCTSRHLGRIFQQLVGKSFSDKRSELRLERARELLATSNCKIVDVALESGYKSLSLFNLMFARHFGVSPGKWRLKREANGANAATNGGKKAKKPAPATGALASLRVNLPEPSSPNARKYSGQEPAKPNGLIRISESNGRFALFQNR